MGGKNEHCIKNNWAYLDWFNVYWFYNDYDSLLRSFLNYIYTASVADNKKKEMIAVIADHLYKSVFVLDKEINCFACWINLERIV